MQNQSFKQKNKTARQYYFSVTLPSFIKSNPSKFWRYLRTSNNTQSHTDSGERTEKANEYNIFFQSVFTTDNGATPPVLSLDSPSIDHLEVTDTGILNLLLNLDPKKSSGPDDIPNEFLKRYAEWCSKFLGLIFRKSLTSSQLPDDWKIAKIIPIHKSGEQSLVSNYRPISLTSISCKLLEHIILKHITVFLEKIKFLSPNQHGFRSGLSTVTQLTEVVHDLASTINNRGQTDIILLDFSKAFDCVCHRKLLIKLKSAIGEGLLFSWIENFLTNRSQFVQYEGHISNIVPVTSGVPQGSVLGPLLFLIFINDLTSNINCNIKLFADDCIIYKEVTSYTDHINLNECLTKLADWCAKWQMSINVKKSAAMTVTRKQNPSQFIYTIHGSPLTNVVQHKYLGITLTSDLRWDTHIANVTAAALRKLFYLKRRLRIAPAPAKLLAYTMFVRPVLEYANVVWFPYTLSGISKLEAVQRKAIRFVHNKFKRTDSPTNLLASSGIEKLATRAKEARLRFLYQLLHGHYKVDVSKYVTFSQSRPTRHKHKYSLQEYSSNSDVFGKSFFPLTIREWNKLNANATNADTLSTFTAVLETMRNLQ